MHSFRLESSNPPLNRTCSATPVWLRGGPLRGRSRRRSNRRQRLAVEAVEAKAGAVGAARGWAGAEGMVEGVMEEAMTGDAGEAELRRRRGEQTKRTTGENKTTATGRKGTLASKRNSGYRTCRPF